MTEKLVFSTGHVFFLHISFHAADSCVQLLLRLSVEPLSRSIDSVEICAFALPHSFVFPFSLSLARATEYGYLYVALFSLRFSYVLLISKSFPGLAGLWSSETPRHFDELVKTSLAL